MVLRDSFSEEAKSFQTFTGESLAVDLCFETYRGVFLNGGGQIAKTFIALFFRTFFSYYMCNRVKNVGQEQY